MIKTKKIDSKDLQNATAYRRRYQICGSLKLCGKWTHSAGVKKAGFIISRGMEDACQSRMRRHTLYSDPRDYHITILPAVYRSQAEFGSKLVDCWTQNLQNFRYNILADQWRINSDRMGRVPRARDLNWAQEPLGRELNASGFAMARPGVERSELESDTRRRHRKETSWLEINAWSRWICGVRDIRCNNNNNNRFFAEFRVSRWIACL